MLLSSYNKTYRSLKKGVNSSRRSNYRRVRFHDLYSEQQHCVGQQPKWLFTFLVLCTSMAARICLVPPELLVSVSGYIRYLQCRWRRGAAPVKLALSHWGLVLAEIWFNNNHCWKDDDVSHSTPYSLRFCVYIRVCVCVGLCIHL